jgi:hypothetical protein
MSDDKSLARRIERLEAANAELTRGLTVLRQELATMRAGGFRSMRDSNRCPACGSGSLLRVRRSRQGTPYGGAMDFAIAQEATTWRGIQPRGPIESFSCRRCGLVEYHVIDFADVKVDGVDIIAIEPEAGAPQDGPFR